MFSIINSNLVLLFQLINLLLFHIIQMTSIMLIYLSLFKQMIPLHVPTILNFQ